MRCRPSTRMSLTVKLLSGLTAGASAFAAGWGGAMPNAACGSTVSCAQAAGAVMAVARARTRRRRAGGAECGGGEAGGGSDGRREGVRGGLGRRDAERGLRIDCFLCPGGGGRDGRGEGKDKQAAGGGTRHQIGSRWESWPRRWAVGAGLDSYRTKLFRMSL